MRDKQQRMYSTMPNLVLAFHGCDISVFDSIVRQGERMHVSTNEYDWLGNGMYFWEQDLERAWKWAEDAARKANGSVKTPAVIGAVIDRGYCLNFLDNRTPKILTQQYEMFKLKMELRNKQMPVNKDIRNDTDKLLRYLDCAVIEDLHDERAQKNMRPFDTVRGLFQEGKPLYETSGFYEKTHIQICVRNPNCIKGFFAPRAIDDKWSMGKQMLYFG